MCDQTHPACISLLPKVSVGTQKSPLGPGSGQAVGSAGGSVMGPVGNFPTSAFIDSKEPFGASSWCWGRWRARRPEGEGWWDAAVLPMAGGCDGGYKTNRRTTISLGQRKRRQRHKGVGLLFFSSGGIQCDEFRREGQRHPLIYFQLNRGFYGSRENQASHEKMFVQSFANGICGEGHRCQTGNAAQPLVRR